MVLAMQGTLAAPRFVHPMPIDVPSITDRAGGVEWISKPPLAPRTAAGSRRSKQRRTSFGTNPTSPTTSTPASRMQLQAQLADEHAAVHGTPSIASRRRTRLAEKARLAAPGDDAMPAVTPHASRKAPLDREDSEASIALPFTPAPTRPPGEAAIERWLEEAGLGANEGLLDALLDVADDMTKLRGLTDAQLTSVIRPLKMKSLRQRKTQAAFATLRMEAKAFEPDARELEWRDGVLERPLDAPLDLGTSVTAEAANAMPPPMRPRIGNLRQPANAHKMAHKPRTKVGDAPNDDARAGGFGAAAKGRRASEPSALTRSMSAATEIGREGKELGELADLLGGGKQPSIRPENAKAAASAASLAMEAVAEAMEASAAAALAATVSTDRSSVVSSARRRVSFSLHKPTILTTVVTPRTALAHQKSIEELVALDLQAALKAVAVDDAANEPRADGHDFGMSFVDLSTVAKKPTKTPKNTPTKRATPKARRAARVDEEKENEPSMDFSASFVNLATTSKARASPKPRARASPAAKPRAGPSPRSPRRGRSPMARPRRGSKDAALRALRPVRPASAR